MSVSQIKRVQKPKLNDEVWRRHKIRKGTTKHLTIKSVFYVTKVCNKNNVRHDSTVHDATIIDLMKPPR